MKIETALIIIGMAGSYAGSSAEYVSLRNRIVDYYCGHYRQLEAADDGEFNDPAVYTKIYQTCNNLKI
jgi:hypothetical protein